jgi:hypothetical protein
MAVLDTQVRLQYCLEAHAYRSTIESVSFGAAPLKNNNFDLAFRTMALDAPEPRGQPLNRMMWRLTLVFH